MGIINCTNCKGEMIKLKNWKAQYNGDIANMQEGIVIHFTKA